MPSLISILNDIQNVKVIDASIDYSDYVAIDLSISNKDLDNFDLTNAEKFENFIENYLKINNSKVVFGGYYEIRNIYKRSQVFKNDISDERNIHIGLDLWIKSGTAVLAALDGKIHSFKNNKSLGDYGPTIILEHEIEKTKFYTLYGHLSEESLNGLFVGKTFIKGEKLATLGNYPLNGDYSPHLHFQIIENIEQYYGDYPGVCNIKDLDFYLKNCPNPNVLLKI
jgi:murein DD-endopeptidase MepM/ murein hydrolase activator NlpD